MRLTKKKFEDIILEIIGEDGLLLVNLLKKNKNISEFDIASQLNLDIKLVRKLLYRLYDRNLVSSTRKKDKQKGWYIYYWTILPDNVKHLYKKMLTEKIARLKAKLHKEENDYFFTCSRKCVKLDFNQSLDFEFKCPECGELISAYDASKNIEYMKKIIDRLEKSLKSAMKVEVVKKVKKVAKKTVKKKTTKKVTKKTVKKLTKKKKTKKTSKKSTKKKTSKKITKKKTKK
tara:strand:- start:304 stop:996 length:693 start_codon:yes stop_codon:yes gene_type:complete